MNKFLGVVKTIVKRAIGEKRSGDERRDRSAKIKKPIDVKLTGEKNDFRYIIDKCDVI